MYRSAPVRHELVSMDFTEASRYNVDGFSDGLELMHCGQFQNRLYPKRGTVNM